MSMGPPARSRRRAAQDTGQGSCFEVKPQPAVRTVVVLVIIEVVVVVVVEVIIVVVVVEVVVVVVVVGAVVVVLVPVRVLIP